MSYIRKHNVYEPFLLGTNSFEAEGTKFYFGLFGNFEPVPYFRLNKARLYVNPVASSQSGFTVAISGTSSNYIAPTEVSMDADQVSIQSDGIRDRAVVVESISNDPLSIVAYAEEFTSSDTFKILPCVFLPVQVYEYYAVSVPRAKIPEPDYDGEVQEPLGNSAIVIVTTEKDTELTITLTQNVLITAQDLLEQIPKGRFEVGVPATVRLSNAAQTLYIASLEDLTGSRITSNKPIAFICGHECGTIPGNFEFCDQLLEQVPPTATWGRTFVTCPIDGRNAHDVFKIIASNNNSVIDASCTGDQPLRVFHLQKGEFTTFDVLSTVHCYVSSNKPVLLVQYSIVSSVDSVFRGDPFMVIVPPIEQYRPSYIISTLPSSFRTFPQRNYINILLPKSVNPTGLLLNGSSLSEDVSFIPVPCGSGDEFCGSSAQVSIPGGQHTLTHVNSSALFNAIVYWLSYRVGSGYFAGMNQHPIARMLQWYADACIQMFI